MEFKALSLSNKVGGQNDGENGIQELVFLYYFNAAGSPSTEVTNQYRYFTLVLIKFIVLKILYTH